jgi:hypothetical protein
MFDSVATGKPSQPKTPEVCPVCGEDVPRGSVACPACGADHQSGWREDAEVYDGTGLPDDEFDYDEFIGREFGTKSNDAGANIGWWVISVVLVILFGVIYLVRAVLGH